MGKIEDAYNDMMKKGIVKKTSYTPPKSNYINENKSLNEDLPQMDRIEKLLESILMELRKK